MCSCASIATQSIRYLPYVIAVTANGNAVVIEKNKNSFEFDNDDTEDEIVLSPMPESSAQLKEALVYACKFSTVDGIRKNLERKADTISDEDSQNMLKDILSVNDGALIAKIQSVLATLN